MKLRKGKTKSLLESSIDAALLAVEVYNKPRTTFRSEAYITLMIIAWTKLFHAYFNSTIGDKYYYKKKKSNRYERVDGERKAWELKTCINNYGKLREPIKKNLDFFIKLRNKIEHRHIDKRDIDILIFGECQALLYNYENMLIEFFGPHYALHESLVYTLQFSHLRTKQQLISSKSALSKDIQDIVSYIEKYRSSLPDNVFESQEYSIKLLQIPKISNTNRSDLAIEFVRWDELSEEDKEAYQKITAIVKDKKIKVEAINVGKLKPSEVVKRIKAALPGIQFTIHTHTCLYKIFGIRPNYGVEDPFDTDTRFCHYDEAHNDYLYKENWVEFIINLLQSKRLTIDDIKLICKNNQKLAIDDYLP